MKIAKHTPDRLILRSGPYALIFLGVGIILFGLVVEAIFGIVFDLSCERTGPKTIHCMQTEKLFWLVDLSRLSLEGVSAATLEENKDDNTSQVVLQTQNRRVVPLFVYHLPIPGEKEEMVRQINAFINRPHETSLNIRRGISWPFWCLAPMSLVGGIFLMLLSQTTTLDFDKSRNLMTLAKCGMFFLRITQYPLKDISAAEVEASTGSEDSTSYRLNLVLVSGKKLPLSRVFTGWRGDKQKAAQVINQFLKDARNDGLESHSIETQP